MIFSGCQAIYAVMVTTPEQRLSEPVLAEAVALYYTEQRMIPAGIHMEAVSQLAGKMAMGIKKMVIKFRRTWKESPDQSKLKGLTELKARLKKTLSEENLTSPRSATAEEVETVTKAVPPVRPEVAVAVQSAGVDWQAAAAKLRAFKEKQSKQQTEKRPVATPARSAKHLLPAHVVDTLKLPSEAVQPFAITGKHKDDIAEENEEDEGKAPKNKKKNLTCKAGIRWKEKKPRRRMPSLQKMRQLWMCLRFHLRRPQAQAMMGPCSTSRVPSTKLVLLGSESTGQKLARPSKKRAPNG